MFSYFAQRLLASLPVIFGVTIAVSLMIHAVPGDPADSILGEYASEEEKIALRSSLGLDQPIALQISGFFSNLVRGELGDSLIHQRPVAELIAERYWPTIELALASLLVATLIAVPCGALAALLKGSLFDHLTMVLSLVASAVPNFWLGPMLILVFSLSLGLVPVSERTGLTSYILPAITLGSALGAILCRMTRNALLDTLGEDYVRTARAKGVSPTWLLIGHGLPNASLPIITVLGLQLGGLLTGAVVTESIFDWPGLGSLMLEALGQRDYPLVQGCVLCFALSYTLVNLATDFVYAIFDPRTKPTHVS